LGLGYSRVRKNKERLSKNMEYGPPRNAEEKNQVISPKSWVFTGFPKEGNTGKGGEEQRRGVEGVGDTTCIFYNKGDATALRGSPSRGTKTERGKKWVSGLELDEGGKIVTERVATGRRGNRGGSVWGGPRKNSREYHIGGLQRGFSNSAEITGESS